MPSSFKKHHYRRKGVPCRVLAFDCSVLCQLTLSHLRQRGRL